MGPWWLSPMECPRPGAPNVCPCSLLALFNYPIRSLYRIVSEGLGTVWQRQSVEWWSDFTSLVSLHIRVPTQTRSKLDPVEFIKGRQECCSPPGSTVTQLGKLGPAEMSRRELLGREWQLEKQINHVYKHPVLNHPPPLVCDCCLLLLTPPPASVAGSVGVGLDYTSNLFRIRLT